MLLSLSRWEYQATTMIYENLNAEHHLTSSLIGTNHWKILKNPFCGFFKGIFSLVPTPNGWRTDETYEGEVQKFLSQSSTWQFFIIQWQNPTEMY